MSAARTKSSKAYLKCRHRSGGTRATHAAIIELLFFGTHFDGYGTVKKCELVVVLESSVQCSRKRDEWRTGS